MKRIAVVMGAYGSGKSEFCAQLALRRAPCAIADMDVLNPYFRVRELFASLAKHEIEIIDSILGHQQNQDIPAISGAIAHYVKHKDSRLIVDLAGSENGLKALRIFDDAIGKEDHEVLMVMNPYRLEMDAKAVMAMVALFQDNCQLTITGLVNNSNLIDQTRWEHIVEGQQRIKEISEQVQLPILYTMMHERFASKFDLDDSEVIAVKTWLLREEWMGDKYA